MTVSSSARHTPRVEDEALVTGKGRFSDDPQLSREFGVQGRFAQIDFDFELQAADAPVEQKRMQRVRALED